MSDSKSLQVSWTLLSILTNLNNAVVWIVSTCPLISFINPWVIVPSAPIPNGITIIFMFQRFFSSLARFEYLSLFSLSFDFTLWSAGMAKCSIRDILFFCPVVWPRLDELLIFQNHREVCLSHSLGQILGCAYTTCSYGQI